MVFWKRLFSNLDTLATSESTELSGELGSNGKYALESKILFSIERDDIDLYELEELCDRVGWARRPLRKVKKLFNTAFW